MLGFWAVQGSPVVIRLMAEKQANASYDLFRVNQGTWTLIGSDPDMDGVANFPYPQPPDLRLAAMLHVRAAKIAGGKAPIRLKVQQNGVDLTPDNPNADVNQNGVLLGEAPSGSYIDFPFGVYWS
jgi:hypothetical protein